MFFDQSPKMPSCFPDHSPGFLYFLPFSLYYPWSWITGWPAKQIVPEFKLKIAKSEKPIFTIPVNKFNTRQSGTKVTPNVTPNGLRRVVCLSWHNYWIFPSGGNKPCILLPVFFVGSMAWQMVLASLVSIEFINLLCNVLYHLY